jgi:hypothetical protein
MVAGRSTKPLDMMLWIVSALGVVAFAAIAVLRMAMASRKWPTVQGRVLSAAEIKSAATPPYSFAYEYTVEGTRHISGTIGLLAPEMVEHAFTQRLTAGSKVTVYYNPRQPKRAVLLPGPGLRLWGLVAQIVVVSLVAAGVASWWALVR